MTDRTIRVERVLCHWSSVVNARVFVTRSMAAVASQTQERRRLVQQVVGHGAVRLVAVAAIFRYGRMLVDERSLLVGMAFPAEQIQSLRLDVAFILSVCVVAIGAGHQSFIDGVVRR